MKIKRINEDEHYEPRYYSNLLLDKIDYGEINIKEALTALISWVDEDTVKEFYMFYFDDYDDEDDDDIGFFEESYRMGR